MATLSKITPILLPEEQETLENLQAACRAAYPAYRQVGFYRDPISWAKAHWAFHLRMDGLEWWDNRLDDYVDWDAYSIRAFSDKGYITRQDSVGNIYVFSRNVRR